MGKINFELIDEAPLFRKIAFGSWRTVGDPSVYGLIELDMTHALSYAQKISEREGIKVTPAHLVGRAAAQVLARRPEINGMIRQGRLYRRTSIDIFYQVNIPGVGDDPIGKGTLAGAVLRGVDRMSVAEIARTLREKADLVRKNEEPDVRMGLKAMAGIPWRLMRWALNISSFLNYDLNLDVRWLGIPQDPFGSLMITNVGSMGIEMAWAPLVPYTRVPMLLTLGAVHEAPRAENGQVVVRPIMKIGVTFDHRFIDGSHAAAMAYHFKKCFEDPAGYLEER